MKPRLTLKTSLVIDAVAITLIISALVAYSIQLYRSAVLESEKTSLTELLGLKVAELLREKEKDIINLGQALQGAKNLRDYLADRDKLKMSEFLDSQFRQYFNTAGILKIEKLYIFDSSLKLLAQSARGLKLSSNLPMCETLITKAKQRQGSDRLKVVSRVCAEAGRGYYAVLMPIGGFKTMGYVYIITNLGHIASKADETLGMPVRVRFPNLETYYESSGWPEEGAEQTLITSFVLRAPTAEAVLYVDAARNVRPLLVQWRKTSWFLIMGALFVLVPALIVSFFKLKLILRPLEDLKAASENLVAGRYEQIENSVYPEIDVAIQAFNSMSSKISELIGSLEKESAEHRDTAEQLSQHRAMIEQARDQAVAASTAKSQFLANMSHELRTPLNAIIGYAELLMEMPEVMDNPVASKDLMRIHDSGKHLLTLINGVLDLSKVEAGKMEVTLEDVKVDPFVAGVVDALRPIAESGGNRIIYENRTEAKKITTDELKLRQVLMNLLSNALKFTDKGVVEITFEKRVKAEKSWWLFKVSDNGIGMSEKQIKHLFQDFTQGDPTVSKQFGGTGLGLAISRKFCNLLGGEILVESRVNEGSKFIVELPQIDKKPDRELPLLPDQRVGRGD